MKKSNLLTTMALSIIMVFGVNTANAQLGVLVNKMKDASTKVAPKTQDGKMSVEAIPSTLDEFKALQAELREGNMDRVLQFAEEQEKCGARILDVNMGMSGIDEKAMMLRAIQEVSGVTNLPISLDSSHVDVLESALRNYPGRALVNSVSLEKEKFEKLLPIVAKYGAVFILLPLSDKGLPENIEEKIGIIHTIYDRALELGMTK